MATSELYPYTPNQDVTLAAAALFGLSAFIHLIMMIMRQTWFYTAMTIGSFMMTAGYAARYLSIKSPDSIPLYAMQSLLILLPPSLYAATIYMIYGRVVLLVNAPDASIIRPTRVTKIFVVGDVISFMIQLGGGGMEASASSADLGQKVMLVGLVVQLIFFSFFLTVAITFDRRMSKSPLRYTIPKYGKHSWRSLLLLLLGAAFVIIGRCVYRVIEFSNGRKGYLMTNEWCMYAGDAAPMFFVQAAFHFIHAGDVFPKGGLGKMEDDERYINLENQR